MISLNFILSLTEYKKVLKPQALKCFSEALSTSILNEPVHEISNNVVCATSKASDQPAHTHSLIRAFVSRLSIL